MPPDYPLAPRPPDPASADGAARAADAVAEIARGPVTDRNGRPDHVTEVLATLTEAQLWEVLTQMKGIVRDGPDQARQLLISHPQLTRALLQALVMLGVTRSPSEPRSAPADQPWPAHAPAPEPQLRDTRGPPADPYARPPGYGAEPAARDDPYAYTAPRQDPYARDPEPRGGYYARDAYPAEGAYPRDGGYGRDDPYARGYGRDAPPGPAPHDMGRAPPAADMGAPLPAGDPRG